jgi:hypothetical protein
MPIWKQVTKPPFDSCYEVSSEGVVRRIPGKRKDGRYVRGGELRPVLVRGYHYVLLQCDGKKLMTRVHILVALAFLGEPPGPIGVTGYTVNHKNFDKTDNRADNLEWLTAHENHQHAVDGGRKARGERHYKSKLTEDIVRQMRNMRAAGMRVKDIAEHFGHKEHIASDVLLGRCWKHVT